MCGQAEVLCPAWIVDDALHVARSIPEVDWSSNNGIVLRKVSANKIQDPRLKELNLNYHTKMEGFHKAFFVPTPQYGSSGFLGWPDNVKISMCASLAEELEIGLYRSVQILYK